MSRPRLFFHALRCAGLLAGAWSGVLWAGSPRLSALYPAGAQAGTEMEVVCSGSNLEDAEGMVFDQPGFEVSLSGVEKGKFKAKIKVAPDVRLGEHRVRVATASGLSDVRLFFVSPFPLVEEQEFKDAPDKAQPVPLGTTVYGHAQGEDQDHFEVELKKGQRLSAEVIAARLQSQNLFDAFLTLARADGKALKEIDDSAFSRQDPVASIVAPEDGKYRVSIREATNSGQGDCAYLLHIGEFVRPTAAYPAGGQAGSELQVQWLGDASGPIEQTVPLPAQAMARWEVFPAGNPPTPQPLPIRVSNMPNVLEAEPNDAWNAATATPGTLPIALNGVLGQKGDHDFFKISAKKNQEYDVRVLAREVRSPVDSVLTILDDKGKGIANNDDSGGPDSYLRWKAPADGDFEIQIKDLLNRGGPDFVYRVEIAPVQPRLTVWLPEMVQNSSQERRSIIVPRGNRSATLVRIKRWDVGGEVVLEPADLPEGVQASVPHVDKGTDTVPVVFEAAPDAPRVAGRLQMEARLAEPPKDGPAVPSAIEHDVDVIENGNQKSYYSIREDRLPVAVAAEVPVTITLVEPKVPVLQNGSLNLKVRAERRDGFKGAINLSLLYVPNGIGTSGSAQIKEGETETTMTVSASGSAPAQKWKVCVAGSVDMGKGPVWISTQLVDLQVAAPFLGGQISRSFVDQGETTTVSVKLDQKAPFEGKGRIKLLGLPNDVTAEECEVTKDDKEVQFTIKAGSGAPAGSHRQLFCQFSLIRDGEEMTTTFASGGILRVDKASLAKKEPPKP